MANKKTYLQQLCSAQVFILDFLLEDKRKCILQTMQTWNCAVKYGWRSFNKPCKWKKTPDQSDGSWDEPITTSAEVKKQNENLTNIQITSSSKKLRSNSTKCHRHRFFIKSFNWCMLPKLFRPKGWNYVGIKTSLQWATW